MSKSENTGGCWPSYEQTLLLRASLLRGKEATEAWQDWNAKVDIDHVDPGSRRMLPLLYQNLQREGITDPVMQKLKGIYRLTWYKNQTLMYDSAKILSSFHRAGLSTMILKGAALTLYHYKNCGLRPMDDLDVFVRTEDARAAIEVLKDLGCTSTTSPLKGFKESDIPAKLGWVKGPKPFEEFTEGFFHVRHAHAFLCANGLPLDLHWHLLPECCNPAADDDFWDEAIPISVHGVPTYILNPTDQFFHICVHGARWNKMPPLRWVSDAVTILHTSQSKMNWTRLLSQATKRQLVLVMGNTLSYLKTQIQAPVPPQVLRVLAEEKVSRIEKISYKARTNSPGLLEGFVQLYFDYKQYTVLSSESGLAGRFFRFPRFLQHTLGFEQLRQVPLYVLFECLRRIWRIILRKGDRLVRASSQN